MTAEVEEEFDYAHDCIERRATSRSWACHGALVPTKNVYARDARSSSDADISGENLSGFSLRQRDLLDRRQSRQTSAESSRSSSLSGRSGSSLSATSRWKSALGRLSYVNNFADDLQEFKKGRQGSFSLSRSQSDSCVAAGPSQPPRPVQLQTLDRRGFPRQREMHRAAHGRQYPHLFPVASSQPETSLAVKKCPYSPWMQSPPAAERTMKKYDQQVEVSKNNITWARATIVALDPLRVLLNEEAYRDTRIWEFTRAREA